MEWAQDPERTGRGITPGTRAVLVVLAQHADRDGRGAYPGLRKIAGMTGLSERTVRYALRTLEHRGLISPGDPSRAEHIRKDLRPHVYDLMMNLATLPAPRGARLPLVRAMGGNTVPPWQMTHFGLWITPHGGQMTVITGGTVAPNRNT